SSQTGGSHEHVNVPQGMGKAAWRARGERMRYRAAVAEGYPATAVKGWGACDRCPSALIRHRAFAAAVFSGSFECNEAEICAADPAGAVVRSDERASPESAWLGGRC